MSYIEWQPASAPAWLAGPWGTKWLQAHGVQHDTLVDVGARQAVASRYLGKCPDDALVLGGLDRGLERVPAEPTDQYRSRLRAAWDAYQWAGTIKGIKDQLAIAGYSNVRILENNELVGDDYDPSAWWRFIVRILQPHNLGDGSTIHRYGDGHTYGDGSTYGGIPKAASDLIRRIVAKWKPAHAVCLRIEVVLAGRLFGDPTFTYGDGTSRYGGIKLSFPL